ncbi:MAG: hypothetical protein ABIM98_08655 [candidate division WOR-3 bacterium]
MQKYLIYFLIVITLNSSQTIYTKGKSFTVYFLTSGGDFEDYVIGGISYPYRFNAKDLLLSYSFEGSPFDYKVTLGFHEYRDEIISVNGYPEDKVIWNRVRGFHLNISMAQTSKAWRSVCYGIGGTFGWFRDEDLKNEKGVLIPDKKEGPVALPSIWVRKGGENTSVYLSLVSDGILPLSATMGAVKTGISLKFSKNDFHIGFLIPTYNLEFDPYFVYQINFEHIVLSLYLRANMLRKGGGIGLSLGVK